MSVNERICDVQKLCKEAEVIEFNSTDDEELKKGVEFVKKLSRLVKNIETDFSEYLSKINKERLLNVDNNEEKNLESEQTVEPNTEETDIKPFISKPIIKLVDLNKLLDPKQKKTVKFDSSVIILTSSDEDEDSMNSSRNKKNGLKTTSLKNPRDSSDSDEKSSRKSSRIKKKDVDKKKRREILKTTFKRCSNKNFEIVNKDSEKKADSSSDEASDKETLKNDKKFGLKVRINLVRMEEQENRVKKRGHSSDENGDSSVKKKRKATQEDKDKEDNNKNTENPIEDKETESSKEDEISDVLMDEEKAKEPEEKTKKADKEATQQNDKTIETTDNDNKEKDNVANEKSDSDEVDDEKGEKTSNKSESEDEVSSTNENKETEKKKRVVINDSDEEEKDKLEESNESVSESDDKKEVATNKKKKEKEKKKVVIDSDEENTEKSEETKSKSGSENDDEDEMAANKKKNKKKKEVVINDSDEEIKEKTVESTNKSGNESDDDEEEIAANKKKNNKNEEQVINDSDEENSEKTVETKNKSGSESDDEEEIAAKKKKSKRKKKAALIDSDDEENADDKESEKSESDDDDDDDKKDEDEEEEEVVPKKKSRIKKRNDSSDSEEEVETRKHIRKLLDKDSLSETTKKAELEEKERKARIAEKQKKYNRIFEERKDATVDSVVLDYDDKTKEPRLSVQQSIVKHLKPHQVSGIQFMYDACFESIEQTMKSPGSGCILAHCMGLGKTLQVVALTHTLLKNSSKTKVEKVMVVCPINTVLNWKAEYQKWMPKKSQVEVYELATTKKMYERSHVVKEWHDDGGVLIIGYTMFRTLSNPDNKKIPKRMRATFQEGLVDPGPDMVVCDEGHLLKNEKTHLSIAMNRIKTARRIVLTGTPLQNNLKEYWCMVQFIKPNLLGTYKEYLNRFVNPITNGQYTDSTQHDIILMRKRSHVLHKLLDGVVQRRDYSVLEPYLPPKHEYVLFLKLSEVQVKLYKHYMDKLSRRNDGGAKTSFLFTDFQQLQRICTHPRVLADKSKEKREKWDDEDEESEGSLKDFIDDGDDSSNSSDASSDSSSESGSGSGSDDSIKKPKKGRARVTRAQKALRKENNEEESDVEMVEKKEWWQEYCDGEELDNIKNSGKLSMFFEILKECEEIGDKILVFSQSLYTLNCIEYFLSKVDEATHNGADTDKLGGYKGTWQLGVDYYRLDGSSSCDNRAYWCDSFNNPDNDRARLFLISTKAGGLGINLVSANRVIIFDVSWNPSHDIQSIYRVYRFGQTKPSYIYRFVTYGTMEMKIYERQVTKQAISKRVIDEQQIDRHYNQNDLQELYKCDLEPTDRPIPLVPKDVLLAEMLQKYENIIYKYHLHQSLLENKQDECLNEEERKAAWEEFENEKVLRKTTLNPGGYMLNPSNVSALDINAALTNIVRRDNPTWSETQIKGIIPALVRQLQIQIEENDLSMYQRVLQEIQIMNQAKLKESFYQQQMMKYYQQQMLIQKQQQHQASLGNLNINPAQLASYMAGNSRAGLFSNLPGPSQHMRVSSDVIELND